MAEAEITDALDELGAAAPRFPGDPAAAAASARARAQSSTKWAWSCVLLSIVSVTAFAGAVSADMFRQQSDLTVALALIASILPIGTCIFLFCRAYGLRKTAAMADACDTMNFRFAETMTKGQLAFFANLPLFTRGHARKGYYAMEGEVAGWPVVLLEYRYTTGHGKTAQVHNQTVVIVENRNGLPEFELSPKTFWRRLSGIFGAAAIPFATNPAFAAAYAVRGSDVRGIRAAFTPEVVAYFGVNRDWTVESKFGHVAIYRQDKTCTPEECPERVAIALTIVRLFGSGRRDEPQRNSIEGGEATE